MKTLSVFLLVFISFKGYSQYDKKFVGMYYETELFYQTEDSLYNVSKLNLNYGNGTTCLASIYDSISDRVVMSDGYTILNHYRDTIADMRLYLDSTYKKQVNLFNDQCVLLLPKNKRQYYYIYNSASDSVAQSVNLPYDQFSYVVVDMNLKNGKGGISGRLNPLLRQPVQLGHITATRHANGRDWWLLEKGSQDSTYYMFLVTPDTIVLHHTQIIGRGSYAEAYGYSVFSPQGDRFVYTDVDRLTQVFDFDRCTGMLSNVQLLHTIPYDHNSQPVSPDSAPGMLGAVFSASGRYLYLSLYYSLYQFDLQAAHVDSSRTLIALRDSTYLSGFYEVFNWGMLMRNGKIYLDDWNGAPKNGGYGALHVINYPDSPGLKCGFVHDGFPLWSHVMELLPNMPSYRTGALVGSGCDTLTTGVQDIPREIAGVSISPNPATHDCHLHLTLPEAAVVDVTLLDMTGRVVQSITHHQYASGAVDMTFRTDGYAAGMYIIQVSDGVRMVNRKLSIIAGD